jgi:hypothetical protein
MLWAALKPEQQKNFGKRKFYRAYEDNETTYIATVFSFDLTSSEEPQ